MKKFWCLFFMLWPILGAIVFIISPSQNWWFGTPPYTEIGEQIDGLFYLILVIVSVVFVGTHIALGYILFKGATKSEEEPAWFSHGSHNMEVIWTIIPAAALLFIALYQLNVAAEYGLLTTVEKETTIVAEVTARQFEWRIRYPAPGKEFNKVPQPDDLYTVNELVVPANRPVMIYLLSGDVQHAFFVPALRMKKDAVPNLRIPIWFTVTHPGDYDWTCAELCGWGHYKMNAVLRAVSDSEYEDYLKNLQQSQNYDGFEVAQIEDK